MEELHEWTAAAEAVLFASGEPVALDDLAKALDIGRQQMEQVALELARACDAQGRGVRLMRFDDRLQLGTRSRFLPVIERVLTPVKRQSLTQAALETLSVIAYRQPITRMEVEAVRGVQCERALATLAGYGLIEEVGRRESIGRPILYGTTEEFLRHFGLASLEQLPALEAADETDSKDFT